MNYKAISIEFQVPNSSNDLIISNNLQERKHLVELILHEENVITRELTNQEMTLISALAPITNEEIIRQIASNITSNNPGEIILDHYPNGNRAVIRFHNFNNEQEDV